MASSRASRVRVSPRRQALLIFEKASSMGVSMRRHILSRANVVASGNSVNRVPYALRFHPHSFRAYQGGSVLFGIRPGRRCYLRFGLSRRALTIPHLAVAGTKRKAHGF